MDISYLHSVGRVIEVCHTSLGKLTFRLFELASQFKKTQFRFNSINWHRLLTILNFFKRPCGNDRN